MTLATPLRAVAAGAVVVAAAAAFVPAAAKTSFDRRMFPPTTKRVYGRTFDEWTREWWQWIDSLPAAANPLLDATGRFAMVGQHGPVWFLCGVPNASGSIDRTVTVPAGKALFFPVLAALADNTFADDPGGVPLTADQLRAVAVAGDRHMLLPQLAVVLDGHELAGVDQTEVVSSPFEFALPAGNVYQATGVDARAGVWKPAVSGGFWTMLRPLPRGNHLIEIKGAYGSGGSTVDVTYHVTVLDHNL